MDEEPAEVEVKPILRSQVDIAVVVEPPSSEDSSQAKPVKEEAKEEEASRDVADDDDEEEMARETAIAGLGERIVEGAEEPVAEGTNPTAAARGKLLKSFSFSLSLSFSENTKTKKIWTTVAMHGNQ